MQLHRFRFPDSFNCIFHKSTIAACMAILPDLPVKTEYHEYALSHINHVQVINGQNTHGKWENVSEVGRS